MSAAKITALLLFGINTFFFTTAMSIGLSGIRGATSIGLAMASLICILIFYAKSPKLCFARGFLSFGFVVAAMSAATLVMVGDQTLDVSFLKADSSFAAIGEAEAEMLTLVVKWLLAVSVAAGLVFALIGNLMHRQPKRQPVV